MAKINVMIVGATGNIGKSIVDALVDDPHFNTIALVQPSSASKPSVEALRDQGVEIRVVDIEHSSIQELAEVLKGVDIFISAIVYHKFHLQRLLADASKLAGVRRFIPCDWGTACVPGVRKFFDEKLGYQEYVREHCLGFTFVDIGLWFQIMSPAVDLSMGLPRPIYGSGDVKSAITDRRDVGKFVARIIADERTLNKYIFCWAEEVTQNEALALAERISGKKIETVHVSEDELLKKIESAPRIEEYHLLQYMYSLYFRGDNTVENAKKAEYGNALDARELYPDLKLRSLEEYVRELNLK